MQLIVALLSTVALTLTGVTTLPAEAATRCHTETTTGTTPEGKVVTIVREVCEDVPDDQPSVGEPVNDSPRCVNDARTPIEEMPCTSSFGVWFNSRDCYARPGDPQPGPESPAWKGHDPSEGALWYCFGLPAPDYLYFFVSNGDAGAVPAVDGRVLAQEALDRMSLARPAIHTAPVDLTFVGLDTWLWMDGSQWREITGGTSVSTASVRVVATPLRVTWDLTEGSTTCDSAGRAWVRGMSNAEETSCSHIFQKVSDFQSGGRFPVTAVIAYQVDWTCSGSCIQPSGSLGEVNGPIGQAAMRVGERQSVVVEGR